MNVIMLDFDGVMAPLTVDGSMRIGKGTIAFSEAAVKNLNTILDAHKDLKIVISSSWRRWGLEYLKTLLKANGIDSDRAIDITGNEKGNRGYQIQCWLDKHPEVTNFVILDDDSDMPEMLDKLVKTNCFVGLTSKDIEQAVKILKI